MIDKKEILNKTVGAVERPKPLPQQKSAGLNDPYDRSFIPSPSGSVNVGAGVQFARPTPIGERGPVKSKDNSIGSYRTLGKYSGQVGTGTLPDVQNPVSTFGGVKTSSPNRSMKGPVVDKLLSKKFPASKPSPVTAFPNGPKGKTVGNTQPIM